MKTNLDTLFKTDRSIEQEKGIKVSISDDIYFILLRFNQDNPNTKAAWAAYYKPYARQIELGTLDSEKTKEIMARLFANTSLIGWGGVKDEKGELIPFSKEAAVKLLIELPELTSSLLATASDFKNFLQEPPADIEALGNS